MMYLQEDAILVTLVTRLEALQPDLDNLQSKAIQELIDVTNGRLVCKDEAAKKELEQKVIDVRQIIENLFHIDVLVDVVDGRKIIGGKKMQDVEVEDYFDATRQTLQERILALIEKVILEESED